MQRGAARGVSVPHRLPHSPSHARTAIPFALSLSKGLSHAPCLRRHECKGAVASVRPEGNRRGHGRRAGHPDRHCIPDSPTPRRRGASRSARPAAAGPSPLHHQQPPPARRTTPRVIPAKAGIQRGAARGVSIPHRIPYSPTVGPHRDSVRPEPVEGSPTTNPRRIPDPTPRRRGASRSTRPAAAGLSPLRHQQPSPTRPPTSSFSRKRESRAGARRGGVPVSRRSHSPPRVIHAQTGTPRGRGGIPSPSQGKG